MCVVSIDNRLYLLSDLDKFVDWFENIYLSLNIYKIFKVLTFTHSCLPLFHSYNILGSDILNADKFLIDLVLKLISSLDPRPCIDMMCCKDLDS